MMLVTILLNSLLVAAAVMIHYEMLRFLSTVIPGLHIRHRFKVAIGVLGALCAHIVEIWMFGLAYFFMLKFPWFGVLKGNFDGFLLDCVYFSFTTYTSLGFGDIEPLGSVRFLAGLEALTGLVLITWTASFMFIEMQKFWDNN